MSTSQYDYLQMYLHLYLYLYLWLRLWLRGARVWATRARTQNGLDRRPDESEFAFASSLR